ncbi:unnamed protein product [Plasmodium vivax]|uniref:(malaria parasite P. vivax) hypothetical protein n=1 Tax=Plasmodium vivax TaxID=5855 RepID=A0A8S4H6I8_PLAVI|nr:unnamed protein product [Plasmodium vivax]
MTENIYDIDKWKKEYPFLESIWKFYVKFDKSVDKNDTKDACSALCDLVREQEGIAKGMYNDFCMKLVRNLGPFSSNPKYERLNSDSCQILNQWVYYMTTKDKIPDNFTQKIFDKSNEKLSVMNKRHVCLYDSYKEKIQEPLKIIKIFNLQIVMDELVNILMKDNHKNNCSCRNFVSECTNTYKRMNRYYCSGVNKEDPKNNYTCFRLSTFKGLYEFFIRSNPDLISKLPSLTDDNMKDIVPCESEKSREELNSITSEGHKPNSPIKIGTNAVLGTMAGFTPLGKWFGPRHLRGTLASNNIGKQAEYELFHNGPEDENISFDQTRYSVAYSPV